MSPQPEPRLHPLLGEGGVCGTGSFCAGTRAQTQVLDNKDGTHTVTYVPLTAGMYTLLLTYGGQPVPGFPARVVVDPAVDTSRVRVFGPGLAGKGRLVLRSQPVV